MDMEKKSDTHGIMGDTDGETPIHGDSIPIICPSLEEEAAPEALTDPSGAEISGTPLRFATNEGAGADGGFSERPKDGMCTDACDMSQGQKSEPTLDVSSARKSLLQGMAGHLLDQDGSHDSRSTGSPNHSLEPESHSSPRGMQLRVCLPSVTTDESNSPARSNLPDVKGELPEEIPSSDDVCKKRIPESGAIFSCPDPDATQAGEFSQPKVPQCSTAQSQLLLSDISEMQSSRQYADTETQNFTPDTAGSDLPIKEEPRSPLLSASSQCSGVQPHGGEGTTGIDNETEVVPVQFSRHMCAEAELMLAAYADSEESSPHDCDEIKSTQPAAGYLSLMKTEPLDHDQNSELVIASGEEAGSRGNISSVTPLAAGLDDEGKTESSSADPVLKSTETSIELELVSSGTSPHQTDNMESGAEASTSPVKEKLTPGIIALMQRRPFQIKAPEGSENMHSSINSVKTEKDGSPFPHSNSVEVKDMSKDGKQVNEPTDIMIENQKTTVQDPAFSKSAAEALATENLEETSKLERDLPGDWASTNTVHDKSTDDVSHTSTIINRSVSVEASNNDASIKESATKNTGDLSADTGDKSEEKRPKGSPDNNFSEESVTGKNNKATALDTAQESVEERPGQGGTGESGGSPPEDGPSWTGPTSLTSQPSLQDSCNVEQQDAGDADQMKSDMPDTASDSAVYCGQIPTVSISTSVDIQNSIEPEGILDLSLPKPPEGSASSSSAIDSNKPRKRKNAQDTTAIVISDASGDEDDDVMIVRQETIPFTHSRNSQEIAAKRIRANSNPIDSMNKMLTSLPPQVTRAWMNGTGGIPGGYYPQSGGATLNQGFPPGLHNHPPFSSLSPAESDPARLLQVRHSRSPPEPGEVIPAEVLHQWQMQGKCLPEGVTVSESRLSYTGLPHVAVSGTTGLPHGSGVSQAWPSGDSHQKSHRPPFIKHGLSQQQPVADTASHINQGLQHRTVPYASSQEQMLTSGQPVSTASSPSPPALLMMQGSPPKQPSTTQRTGEVPSRSQQPCRLPTTMMTVQVESTVVPVTAGVPNQSIVPGASARLPLGLIPRHLPFPIDTLQIRSNISGIRQPQVGLTSQVRPTESLPELTQELRQLLTSAQFSHTLPGNSNPNLQLKLQARLQQALNTNRAPTLGSHLAQNLTRVVDRKMESSVQEDSNRTSAWDSSKQPHLGFALSGTEGEGSVVTPNITPAMRENGTSANPGPYSLPSSRHPANVITQSTASAVQAAPVPRIVGFQGLPEFRSPPDSVLCTSQSHMVVPPWRSQLLLLHTLIQVLCHQIQTNVSIQALASGPVTENKKVLLQLLVLGQVLDKMKSTLVDDAEQNPAAETPDPTTMEWVQNLLHTLIGNDAEVGGNTQGPLSALTVSPGSSRETRTDHNNTVASPTAASDIPPLLPTANIPHLNSSATSIPPLTPEGSDRTGGVQQDTALALLSNHTGHQNFSPDKAEGKINLNPTGILSGLQQIPSTVVGRPTEPPIMIPRLPMFTGEDQDHHSVAESETPKNVSKQHPDCRTACLDSSPETAEYQESGEMFKGNAAGKKSSQSVYVPPKRRPFFCHICDLRFQFRWELRKHNFQKHRDLYQFKCEHCPFATATLRQFSVHSLIHKGVRPYKCDVCGSSFTQMGNLYKHKKHLHSTERPYVCQICKRGFPYKHGLISHMRIHTGEKPFECDLCDYKCAEQGALKKHRMIHTGNKPHKCYYANCDASFVNRLCWVKHINRHKTMGNVVDPAKSMVVQTTRVRRSSKTFDESSDTLNVTGNTSTCPASGE